VSFRGYEVFAPGPPSFGGASLAEALNLLELADLRKLGHYRESPQALYQLIRISQVADLLGPPMAGAGVSREVLARHFPGADLSLRGRTTKTHAEMVWRKMQGNTWPAFVAEADVDRLKGAEMIERLLAGWGRRTESRRPQHTSGVVAVDRQGNVVAMMHSINGSYWGNGLVVGGISIPDPGGYQQRLIATVGPGAKLPEPDNPLIVLRDGKPVLASSDHGGGIHETAVQGLLNVLDFAMDPKTAAEMPNLRKAWPIGQPLRLVAGPGEFAASVLQATRALGLPLEIAARREGASLGGYWVAVEVDQRTRLLRAGITPGFNGWAEGY